jgi:hypothetical protein
MVNAPTGQHIFSLPASVERTCRNPCTMTIGTMGVGYQTRRARNPQEPSANLGEIAVDEYATSLSRMTGPGFVPLALFEDPR